MNLLKVGDVVTSSDTGDTKYKVVDVKRIPGPEGAIYLCETDDGIRIQRFSSQLTKVD